MICILPAICFAAIPVSSWTIVKCVRTYICEAVDYSQVQTAKWLVKLVLALRKPYDGDVCRSYQMYKSSVLRNLDLYDATNCRPLPFST